MKKILITVVLIILGLLTLQYQMTGSFDISYEDVTIPVNSHVLAGTIAKPSGSNLPAVVVIHGLSASKEMMLPFINGLARAGMIVLAIDLQGHGMSSGLLMEDGNNSLRYDGVAAFNYLKNRPEVNPAKIGMLGHSMGASTVYQTNQIVTPVANVFIGNDLADAKVNRTNPKNMLMAIGAYDELFSVTTAKATLSRAVGTPIVEGQIYGNYFDGTARKLIIVNTDHIFEVGNTQIITESINWLAKSLGASTVYPVAGWLEMMNSLSSLVMGLFFFALIYNIFKFIGKEQDPVSEESQLSKKTLIPGAIAFIGFLFASLALPIGYQFIFLLWFLIGAFSYYWVYQRIISRNFEKLNDKISILYGVGIFLLIFIPLQILFFFVPWDLRYVLPIFAQLSFVRFLYFLLLWIPATFYFFYELSLLHSLDSIDFWKILFSRIWAFLVLLLIQYLPLIIFHKALLPLVFGFLAFFIVGLIPILIILSALTYAGFKLNVSHLTQAIIYGGYIVWVLMSTIPLIVSGNSIL